MITGKIISITDKQTDLLMRDLGMIMNMVELFRLSCNTRTGRNKMSDKIEKTKNVLLVNDILAAKGKSKKPKKCPCCGSDDILEGDGGDWYYCNNCSWKAFKDS